MITTAGKVIVNRGDADSEFMFSFLWDATETRFLDQAAFQQPSPIKGHPNCPSCAFAEKSNRDTNEDMFLHSEISGEVRGIKYHKDDFVYIAANPNHPYLIGQIRRFIVDSKFTVHNSNVELTLLGRFDDVARSARRPGVQQDEVGDVH